MWGEKELNFEDILALKLFALQRQSQYGCKLRQIYIMHILLPMQSIVVVVVVVLVTVVKVAAAATGAAELCEIFV